MKSYLPAATLGIALTAGAFAFGVAAVQTTGGHLNQGYSVQINGSADATVTGRPVTAVDGLTAIVSSPARRD